MAWYALYKWSKPWRVKPMYNWVTWYSNKLYQEWYDSLTEEEQAYIDEQIKKRKEQRELEARKWFACMNALLSQYRRYV